MFHAFDSAQAAFLGLFAPTSEQHSNRLRLLVVVLVANTEDKVQMEAELLH